jgi:hypothetical protein
MTLIAAVLMATLAGQPYEVQVAAVESVESVGFVAGQSSLVKADETVGARLWFAVPQGCDAVDGRVSIHFPGPDPGLVTLIAETLDVPSGVYQQRNGSEYVSGLGEAQVVRATNGGWFEYAPGRKLLRVEIGYDVAVVHGVTFVCAVEDIGVGARK